MGASDIEFNNGSVDVVETDVELYEIAKYFGYKNAHKLKKLVLQVKPHPARTINARVVVY